MVRGLSLAFLCMALSSFIVRGIGAFFIPTVSILSNWLILKEIILFNLCYRKDEKLTLFCRPTVNFLHSGPEGGRTKKNKNVIRISLNERGRSLASQILPGPILMADFSCLSPISSYYTVQEFLIEIRVV